MKDGYKDFKSELKSKLLFWRNLKSKRAKTAFVLLFLSLIGLKVFTTALTFDWLTEFIQSI